MGTLTVKKRKEDGSMEELRPKKATLDKTTLKTILFIESEGNVDITYKAQFQKLKTFYIDFMLLLNEYDNEYKTDLCCFC